MTPLLILLLCAVATGLLVGLLAKLPPRQLLGQCLLLCVGVLAFWGLVELL